MAKKKGAITNAYAIYDINHNYTYQIVGTLEECADFLGTTQSNISHMASLHHPTHKGMMVEKLGKIKEVFGNDW